MKEYLNTETYEYKLAHTKPDGEWVDVPDGADKYAYFNEYDNANFYKGDFDAVWQDGGYWDHDMDDYKSYCKKFSVVLWQRTTQPEALPFIDDNPQSLNDQYAEIEQVRQQERNSSAWDVQIGGNHYKQFKIQPMQFALENKLDAAQQNVIKYIMRHSFKNGKQDLEKAKHYIDLMIEFYYGENNNG